jgi:hypothetical protein
METREPVRDWSEVGGLDAQAPRLSSWPHAVRGLVSGILIAVVLIGIYLVSPRLGLHGSERILDDLAGGVIVGVLVFFYERHRSRLLSERLHTIHLMNHHVRNALQTISWSRYSSDDQQQVEHIREAVGRIDWALREILPGSETKKDAAP